MRREHGRAWRILGRQHVGGFIDKRARQFDAIGDSGFAPEGGLSRFGRGCQDGDGSLCGQLRFRLLGPVWIETIALEAKAEGQFSRRFGRRPPKAMTISAGKPTAAAARPPRSMGFVPLPMSASPMPTSTARRTPPVPSENSVRLSSTLPRNPPSAAARAMNWAKARKHRCQALTEPQVFADEGDDCRAQRPAGAGRRERG